jgi:hypothetical protein
MNDFVKEFAKWAIIAAIAFYAFRWLMRNGLSGSASFQAQAQPAGWGSGMLYAPGSAYGTAYGYLPGSRPYPRPYDDFPYQGSTPIQASYSPDGGISFSYGF